MTKRALAAVAVFALIAMGQDSCSTTDEKPAKEGGGGNASSGGGSSDPTPDPDGTFSLNCDYLLGDFNADDYKFVGGGKIKNTGNVGIKTQTTFTWELLGQGPVKEVVDEKLPPGDGKRVNVTIPVTQDQIDLHQSADSDCKAKTKIVGTYGKPE